MIRTVAALALASTALVAATAPAQAEESLRVKLAGKTPAQAYSTIVRAAREVCVGSRADTIYSVYVDRACVSDTVAATLKKLNSPALNQYARDREAFLLASR